MHVNPNGGTFKPHCLLDMWIILNEKENYLYTAIILESIIF